MNLTEISPPAHPLYRIGRGEDAWQWSDWAFAGDDGTFGNRWDDPSKRYRVLYACSQRLGAFVETLARYRPDPALVARLDEIEVEAGDDDGVLQPGQISSSWVHARRMGTALVEGTYASVGTSDSLRFIEQAMAAAVVRHNIDELDGSAIRSSAPRAFTQEISRFIYEISDDDGRQQFSGIHYLSRRGDEFENWAIFEPGDTSDWKLISDAECEPIESDDADLDQALDLLGIEMIDSLDLE